MRKLVLLAAAVPLLLSPTALAADRDPAERPSVCRLPDTDIRYDSETFTYLVVLPIDGCRSREERPFVLSASISRSESFDGRGDRDMIERSVICGPYPAGNAHHDDRSSPATCDLAVWLGHPLEEDGVRYDVEVTFPGATADRTMREFTFCTSNHQSATCEH
jgi:hypothetical protein